MWKSNIKTFYKSKIESQNKLLSKNKFDVCSEMRKAFLLKLQCYLKYILNWQQNSFNDNIMSMHCSISSNSYFYISFHFKFWFWKILLLLLLLYILSDFRTLTALWLCLLLLSNSFLLYFMKFSLNTSNSFLTFFDLRIFRRSARWQACCQNFPKIAVFSFGSFSILCWRIFDTMTFYAFA